MEDDTKIICEICNNETIKHHRYDEKLCESCGVKYFDSIKPDLTRAMDGLDVYEKSSIIREIIKDHFEKEKLYKLEALKAKRSCRASYEEWQFMRFSA